LCACSVGNENVVENEGGGLGFIRREVGGEVDAAKVVKVYEEVAWCMLMEECDGILMYILFCLTLKSFNHLCYLSTTTPCILNSSFPPSYDII